LKSPGPVRTGFADRVALATDELLSVDLSEADIIAIALTGDKLDGFEVRFTLYRSGFSAYALVEGAKIIGS